MWSWPLTPKRQKSIEVILWPKAMYLYSLNVKGPWVVKLLIENHFEIQGQCNLDLCSSDPKIIRGHLLAKTNAPSKFEGQKPIACQGIFRIRFYLQGQCNLDLWPLDPKINRGNLLVECTYHVWGLTAHGLSKLLIRNRFYLQGQCNLDIWPLDPKIDRGHLLVKSNTPTKFEGQQPMSCQVIDRKLFLPSKSMWPWPLTPKSMRSSAGHEQSSNQVWGS
jgi:hypothetical protein